MGMDPSILVCNDSDGISLVFIILNLLSRRHLIEVPVWMMDTFITKWDYHF